jgi:hypothetical protein
MFNFDTEFDWALKRRLIYSISTSLLLLGFLIYGFWGSIFPAATCSDLKTNGDESGVDCGGSCALVCKGEYFDIEKDVPVFFKSGDGTYDILVTFKNNNRYSAPKEFAYRLDIYDESGIKVDSIEKTVEASTGEVIPIYIKDYKVTNISKIFATIVDYKMYKTLGATTLRLEDFKFTNGDIPKLAVSYSSPYKLDIKEKISVIVLLYDSLGSVSLVGQTTIDGLYTDKKDDFNLAWRLPTYADIKTVKLIPLTYNYAE